MKYKSVIPLPEVKKRLRGRSEKQLIKMISDCYKLDEEVKFYLSTHLIENESERREMIQELREMLKSSFWSRRGGVPNNPDLKQARKIISNLKKITNDPEIIISFMLDYIDHGISFSREYGDMWEAYYNNIDKMFGAMVKQIVENCNHLEIPAIIKRINEVVEKSAKFGWGVYATLTDWTEELIEDLRKNVKGEVNF